MLMGATVEPIAHCEFIGLRRLRHGMASRMQKSPRPVGGRLILGRTRPSYRHITLFFSCVQVFSCRINRLSGCAVSGTGFRWRSQKTDRTACATLSAYLVRNDT